MLKFGIIFLIPTAILASDYGNNGNYQNQNRDLGGTNLVFNFEQLRRDQPPQIEMRDESLGNYMHRIPQPTTTSKPIIVPEIKQLSENNYPFSRFSNPPSRVNNDYEHQYNPIPLQSTPIYHERNPHSIQSTPIPSPPPAPIWSDFSETFNKQAFPHYESQKQKPIQQKMPAEPEFNNFQRPQHLQSGPMEKPFEHMPAAPEFNHFSQHSTATLKTKSSANYDTRRNPVHSTLPGSSSPPEYNADGYASIRKNTENRSMQVQQQNIRNRGSYKFDWNDQVTEPSWNKVQQVASTAAPAPITQATQGRPYPIPTLTPWLDGF